jgi:hypothetical protein
VRMLRQLGLLSMVLVLTVAACDDDDDDGTGPEPEVFRATLSPANENPPVTNSTATGTATFTVNGSNLDYSVTISNWPAGRTVTAAHIHAAPAVAGGNADPIPGLTFSGANAMTTSGGSGSIALSTTALTQIRAGGTYFNVHSSQNPGGEIRGNLVLQ